MHELGCVSTRNTVFLRLISAPIIRSTNILVSHSFNVSSSHPQMAIKFTKFVFFKKDGKRNGKFTQNIQFGLISIRILMKIIKEKQVKNKMEKSNY